ncbi:aspartate aminotransferase family protein [Rhodobacteraceae bacterium NNCM2]|nr:aspartate aminotransferase family protein [Coraliihabitans acroporae]
MIAPVMPTYARAPLEFERGEGSWLTTTDGRKYLDFGAGIAVNALGHAHPKLVAALETQARRLWHVSNLYDIPEQKALADLLVANTFADTVFFTNSGTEAMEGCIKAARKYWSAKGEDRTEIITFDGSFHGRTIGAISAAGSEKLTAGFGPMLPGFVHVPFGDHDALKAAVGPKTAAIMIEPIQGEGGIRPVPAQELRFLRELCDESGALLILDEIQSGMGRTGHLFAHEAAGITPDLMGIAKGIGGGFPLGAFLATEDAASGMVAGTHGSTYGGNPLACAVGRAVLEEVSQPAFLEAVRDKARFLRQKLAELADDHPEIAEIRGEGLMIGLRIAEGTTNLSIVEAGRAAGILTVPAADNVIRLLPALNISEEELAEGVRRLDQALTSAKAAIAS